MSSERGAATVVAVACLGVLMLLGAALGVVAGMVTAHRQAQSAADLAALAAAAEVAAGGDGCAAGAVIARANDAALVDCSVDGRVVTVEVSVTGPAWRDWAHDLTARARAGPDDGEWSPG